MKFVLSRAARASSYHSAAACLSPSRPLRSCMRRPFLSNPCGSSIYISISLFGFRKALGTSLCFRYQPNWCARASSMHPVSDLGVGAKVSWHSTPSRWVYPLAVHRALYLSRLPSAITSFKNTQLYLIGLRTHGSSWRLIIFIAPFSYSDRNSSFLAFFHCDDWEEVIVSTHVLGSVDASAAFLWCRSL